MNQNTHPLSHISFSVLHLKSPPEPCKTSEWYTSRIAGVPFLLRNIMSLQRSGLHDLIVYIDKSQEEIEKLVFTIKEDARIIANIHWVSNSVQLKETLQNREGQMLLFNGSALHDKKEVRSLLKTFTQQEATTPEALPISKDQLESLIEKIQRNDEKELIEFQEETPFLQIHTGVGTSPRKGTKRFQHPA